MDKKGKNQGRYGGGGGVHSSGKGDDNGRFDGSGNRRPRTDQATFQQRDWESGQRWERNTFQRDKKPPLAGNQAPNMPPNMPVNIESLPVSISRHHSMAKINSVCGRRALYVRFCVYVHMTHFSILFFACPPAAPFQTEVPPRSRIAARLFRETAGKTTAAAAAAATVTVRQQ